MNELLQKHGCANVFTLPEGLKELMSDISREVLREQPEKIYDFIANYLSALLITREHGILAVKILEDLCDCQPTISEHLLQIGLKEEQSTYISKLIQAEISDLESIEGKGKFSEIQIVQKILGRVALDEEMAAKICQIARNAYKDYWCRKKLLERQLKVEPTETWEIAAQNTLNVYKKTKPTFADLTRATTRIQAAYRSYYERKNLLKHLKPNKPQVRPFPPDIVGSREIDLGPIISIGIEESDDVGALFDEEKGTKHGLHYDPMNIMKYEDSTTAIDGSRTLEREGKDGRQGTDLRQGGRAEREESLHRVTSFTQVSPQSLSGKTTGRQTEREGIDGNVASHARGLGTDGDGDSTRSGSSVGTDIGAIRKTKKVTRLQSEEVIGRKASSTIVDGSRGTGHGTDISFSGTDVSGPTSKEMAKKKESMRTRRSSGKDPTTGAGAETLDGDGTLDQGSKRTRPSGKNATTDGAEGPASGADAALDRTTKKTTASTKKSMSTLEMVEEEQSTINLVLHVPRKVKDEWDDQFRHKQQDQ